MCTELTAKVFSCEDEEYACLRELRKVSGWGQAWKSSLGPTFLGFLVTNQHELNMSRKE